MTDTNTNRKGHWIRTSTGRKYYPLDPRAEDVCLEDVAHHLSMICRYGGAPRRFYSVAEHSVLVSYMVKPEHALFGLLHDAQEAYLGDMVRPLKVQMPEYQEVEDLSWRVVAEHFGLPYELPLEVKKADTDILATEKQALGLLFDHMGLDIPAVPPRVKVACMPPEKAEQAFLERYKALTT
jgi:uncharacterized protein